MPMFLANRPGGLTIYDLELRPHFTHWYWTNTEKKLKFWFDGARSWANLKAWLHLFWQGRAPGFCCSSKPDAQNTRLERTLARAFVLVGEMMDAHQEGRKMLWSDIERMLETFREAVDDHPGGSFFAK